MGKFWSQALSTMEATSILLVAFHGGWRAGCSGGSGCTVAGMEIYASMVRTDTAASAAAAGQRRGLQQHRGGNGFCVRVGVWVLPNESQAIMVCRNVQSVFSPPSRRSFFATSVAAQVAGRAEPESKRALVLYGERLELPALHAVDLGLREAFAARGGVEVFTENFDWRMSTIR